MTNPTPYRNKTTGTIAWLNRPYEDWESWQDIDKIVGENHYKGVEIIHHHGHFGSRALVHSSMFKWRYFHHDCRSTYPITITALPEDEWEVVELCGQCDDAEANKSLNCWNCELDWSVIDELRSKTDD